MRKYILGIILILILVILTSCKTQDDNISEICEELEGNYLEEYNECEGINEEECEMLNGNFEECADACRHMDSEMCISVCVPVCYL